MSAKFELCGMHSTAECLRCEGWCFGGLLERPPKSANGSSTEPVVSRRVLPSTELRLLEPLFEDVEVGKPPPIFQSPPPDAKGSPENPNSFSTSFGFGMKEVEARLLSWLCLLLLLEDECVFEYLDRTAGADAVVCFVNSVIIVWSSKSPLLRFEGPPSESGTLWFDFIIVELGDCCLGFLLVGRNLAMLSVANGDTGEGSVVGWFWFVQGGSPTTAFPKSRCKAVGPSDMK